MKMALVLALVFSSAFAQASIQFRSESALPENLKLEIQSTIQANCTEIREMNFAVTELATTVVVDHVDNGLTDTYYTTEFDVFRKELDSNHSRHESLRIESTVTEGNNGTSIQVRIVEGCR